MNSIDATAIVLEKVGKPLHYKEITRKILEQGLWSSEGKTPQATVNANLAVDIKEKGVNSRFQRTASGTYALRIWGLPEYTRKPAPTGKQPKTEDEHPGAEATISLTFNDAAELVLESYVDKQPMHYQKITEKILELGLVHTEGQTPEATLYAQILTEIKRDTKRGETPRFVKHGKGFVGLRKWMGEGLAFQIKRQNDEVRKKLHQRLFAMSAGEFEALVGQLLVALGFEEVIVTKMSSDGGIDVRGTLVVGDVIRTRMAVQVKRWKKNVQAPVVQQVRGSLSTHEQGLIITTSDFSAGAYEEAKQPDKIPVALMNGEQLVTLLIENDISIHRISYDLIDLAEDGETLE